MAVTASFTACCTSACAVPASGTLLSEPTSVLDTVYWKSLVEIVSQLVVAVVVP